MLFPLTSLDTGAQTLNHTFYTCHTYICHNQCWELTPFLAPPRHWRELKKMVHSGVEEKNAAGGVAQK